MPVIQLFGPFREVVGKKEIAIPAQNINELIEIFIKQYKGLADLLLKKKLPLELKEDIIIFLNNTNIYFINGLNTKLNKNDTVAIFPVMGGG